MADPVNTTARNKSYYLDSVTFLVEDELFKIPLRCISFNTEPFKTLSSRSLPSGSGVAEGTSDENPIRLEQASKVDFERLLQVLCPFRSDPAQITSLDVWSSVLTLATQWRLIDIRKLAIEKMTSFDMTSRELVRYGREHKVESWLAKGYLDFATQTASLSEEDAKSFQYGTSDGNVRAILKIVELREKKGVGCQRRRCSYCSYSTAVRCSNCGSIMARNGSDDLPDAADVRSTFKEELDDLISFDRYFNLVDEDDALPPHPEVADTPPGLVDYLQ